MDADKNMTEQDSEHILERMKALLNDGSIKYVKMLDNSSIEIKYAINYDESSTTYESVYEPGEPSHTVIMSLVGELKPGELRYFARNQQSLEDQEIQKVLKPASVAFGIENGDVEKVVRTGDGGISLYMIYDREKPPKEIRFSADAPHIETILKYTGPLEPGETYVFDKLQ